MPGLKEKVNRMKNNRGFTLIEVIVSIALLAIISMGLISGLTSQFRYLKNTQTFTEDISVAQQSIELQISNVKKTIMDGGALTGGEDYTLFDGTAYERTVVGYPKKLEISIGNATRTLFTVVGSEVLEFAVATASVEIEFSSGSTMYEYSPSLSVRSDVTLDDPDHVNLTNIYRWYVSRSGFNIPMISNPEEIEKGTKYPRFPDDYTIIPGASTTTLSSVATRYAGRHLICTVTPAAQSGKMGATAVSNPIFISGLPLHDHLLVHLDASMISKEDAGDVNTEGYVRYWDDISGQDRTASQSNSDKRPRLCETFIGDIVEHELWYETYAKYVRFDGSNDGMYASIVGGATIFAVARNAGEEDFTLYQLGQEDELPDCLSIDSGYLYIGYAGYAVDVAEVIVYNTELTEEEITEVRTYLTAKYMPVAPAVTIQSLHPITVTVLKNTPYIPPNMVSANMSNGKVRDVAVTWSPATIDTSEVGVKYSTATAVSDLSKTTSLTVNVIEPIAVTGVTLNNHTVTMEKGGVDTLVATVEPPDAHNRNITWSSSNTGIVTVDQNGHITGVNTGSATITVTTQDGGFTDTCVVTVTAIPVTGVSLNKSSTTIYRNSGETLIATVSPDNATNKSLTWSSSDTSIVTVDANGNIRSGDARGSATITVTTNDGNFSASCTVYVVRYKVTGVSMNKDTLTLGIGDSDTTLTATVSPSDATVKTVTWASSDSGIATVNSSGIVTGVGVGTTTITVRTDDGGYTDTCSVTVRQDNTPPTVTALGNGWDDYSIPGRASRTLVFSEPLSEASKAAVESALTAGCSRSLTYAWSGASLTITRNGSSTGWFYSDVRANLTDLAGNTSNNVLLINT